MRDEELVLALSHYNLPGYKPPVNSILNEYMRKNRRETVAGRLSGALRYYENYHGCLRSICISCLRDAGAVT